MTLPRPAKAIYWLARYLQRLDDTVRFVEVQINTSLEYRSTTQAGLVLACLGISPTDAGDIGRPQMLRILLADSDNPASVPSCATMALADARAIRDMVPSEVYEAVNTLHRSVTVLAERIEHGTSLSQVLGMGRMIHNHKWTIFGLVNESLIRDEYWYLFRTGADIEYLDMSVRLLRVWLAFATDDYDWITILRSLSAYEAFLRRHRCSLDPTHIVEELFQAHDNPRSLLFAIADLKLQLDRLPYLQLDQLRQALDDLKERLRCASGKELLQSWQELLSQVSTTCNDLNDMLATVYFDPGGLPTWHLSATN